MARTTPVNSGYTIINGATTGSNGSKVDTWLEWKITGQSVVNNTSTVRVVLYSAATTSSSTKWESASNFGYVGYDNGNKQYLSTTYDFSNYKVNKFGDYTYTISHNSDGTKTVTLQGSWSTSHSSYISGGSASGQVTLTRIARASTISNLSTNLGTAGTISITRQSSDFTHTLTYTFGSSSGTIATKTTSTSVSWTPPVSLISQFGANDKTKTGTITCETFSGSTSVGTSTSTLTLTIPNSSLANVSGTYGSALTLTASNACTSGLTYTFAYNNGSSWQSIASTSNKTQSWTPNTSLIANVSNSASGTVSVRVITYRGTTAINTATATATLAVPKNTSSAVSGTIGTALSIPITKPYSGLTSTITYSFGSASGTIATKTTSTSQSWTPPTSLLTQIPNSASGTGTITIQTYNGTASVGSNSYALTLSANTSVVPTSSFTLEMVNDNTTVNGWGIYLQGYSKVKATLTANGISGSTVKSMSVSGTSLNLSSSPTTTSATLTGTSSVLTTSGTLTYTGNASDSRNRSATTKTSQITVYPYAMPSVSGVSLQRSDSTGTIDTSGTYLKVAFTLNYSSANGNNTASVTLRYRARGASSWTTYGTVTNGANLNLNLDVSNNYEAQLLASDALNSNIASATINIPSAERIINVNASGKGLAIGGFSTDAGKLQVYYPTDFEGNTLPTINGGNFIREAKGYALMQKTQIPANADLNNYLTAGSYYTSGNADASSMSNCPTSYAFNMRVDRTIGQTPAEASLTWRGVIQTIWDYYGNHYERYLFYDASTLHTESWRKVLSSTYDSSTNVATMIDSSRWYKGRFFNGLNYSYSTTHTSYATGYKEFAKAVLDDWITMPTGNYYVGVGWNSVSWGSATITVDNSTNYCFMTWQNPYSVRIRAQLWNGNYNYRFFYENDGDTYVPNDTFVSNHGLPINGFITSSATAISLNVPVYKRLTQISTITCTACVGGIRGTSGYVNGSSDSYNWLTASGVTITCGRAPHSNAIVMLIQKTSAFSNVTNNTPLSYSAIDLRFTFS